MSNQGQLEYVTSLQLTTDYATELLFLYIKKQRLETGQAILVDYTSIFKSLMEESQTSYYKELNTL